MGETKLKKEVRLTSCRDKLPKEVKQNIQKGIELHFHLRNGLLCYKQNQLYVPEGRFKDVLLKECHDGSLVGHGGAKCTTTFLKKSYFLPNLKDNAEEYLDLLDLPQNRTINKKTSRIIATITDF
jgi:hypothetical protein